MTAVQEMSATKPAWRYLDDAPPVRPPSRKRRLGAVLAYLVATTGLGVAIFWPRADQELTLREFKIPPSPFTALMVAAAAPQPSPTSAPNSNRPAATASRLPTHSRPRPGLASSAGWLATVAVVAPDTSRAPTQVPTWVPEPQPPQQAPARTGTPPPAESQTASYPKETRYRPRSDYTNSGGDREHRLNSDSSNSETATQSNSTPQPNLTPQPEAAARTTSDTNPASSSSATGDQGTG
jgi:hypothetical protein